MRITKTVTVCVATVGVVLGTVIAIPYVLNIFYNGAVVYHHVPPPSAVAGRPLELKLRIKSFGPQRWFLFGNSFSKFTCIYRFNGERTWRQRRMVTLGQEGGYNVVAGVELPPLPTSKVNVLEYYFSYTHGGDLVSAGPVEGGPFVIPIVGSN